MVTLAESDLELQLRGTQAPYPRLRALGALCVEKPSVTRGGASYQSWNLDAQGNWNSFTSNGTTQTRTANTQNQITSISGTSATPRYDANGNMTTDQNGDTLVYDAWNRLVEVKNSSGQIIAQYTYDARGYAVTATYPQGTSQIPAGTTNNVYVSKPRQGLATATAGTPRSLATRSGRPSIATATRHRTPPSAT